MFNRINKNNWLKLSEFSYYLLSPELKYEESKGKIMNSLNFSTYKNEDGIQASIILMFKNFVILNDTEDTETSNVTKKKFGNEQLYFFDLDPAAISMRVEKDFWEPKRIVESDEYFSLKLRGSDGSETDLIQLISTNCNEYGFIQIDVNPHSTFLSKNFFTFKSDHRFTDASMIIDGSKKNNYDKNVFRIYFSSHDDALAFKLLVDTLSYDTKKLSQTTLFGNPKRDYFKYIRKLFS